MAMAKKHGVGRRRFMTDAAAGAAALVSTPLSVHGAGQNPSPAPATPAPPAPAADVYNTDRPGSDFMVDLIKSLGFEYAAANPGGSFRALHESLVNYGGNRMPELLTCLHEESSVAMAHGYAKIEGKPMLVMAHGTVGLQHASMAIYNAYADRVPVYSVLGNILDIQWRRNDVEWTHAVQDAAAMVRDCIKWDDTPVSLSHFAESAVRAYKIAMTPPMGPVILVADGPMQEEGIPVADRSRLRVPKLTPTTPPAGESGAVNELARLLVAADNPAIIAGRAARTPRGLTLLVELAELLQAPVQDGKQFVQRMNFPSRHPLRGGNVAEADLVLGLEMPDFFQQIHTLTPINRLGMEARRQTKPGTKIATISSHELLSNSNYQDFGRYTEADLAIIADAEATLPSLIEACRRLITPDRRRLFDERGRRLAEASKALRDLNVEQAAWGWDASPISTARMAAELWNLIKDEDWSLVSDTTFVNHWPLKLWDVTRHHHYIGWSGAYGIGYGAPAAVGAALANKKYGRLSVNIQCDGDLNYAPGVLWTAAHHRIPLLTVMHNNRAYHQERMFVADMAARANRDVSRSNIGNELADPFIDYASLAKAYGMYGIGPIENPNELGPALKRAIDVVKRGEPALVDVVTQPR
ncbi:MAG: thiamine pyrophosphate-binding protein [Acidobacteriota bacterium]|nr:thiamine pyrophosphate-binding protein [Acidobacteriota bacterium]